MGIQPAIFKSPDKPKLFATSAEIRMGGCFQCKEACLMIPKAAAERYQNEQKQPLLNVAVLMVIAASQLEVHYTYVQATIAIAHKKASIYQNCAHPIATGKQQSQARFRAHIVPKKMLNQQQLIAPAYQ